MRAHNNDGLTLREQLFCKFYVALNGNGQQAAKAAGYKGAHAVRASQLLKRERVARRIQCSHRAKLSQLDCKAERVLQELVRIAFFDPRSIVALDGTILPVSGWSDDAASVVSGFEFKDGIITKIRFASKSQALELLGRHLKLWDGAGDSENQKQRLHELVNAMLKPANDGAEPTPVPEVTVQ